ncbi:hypothetical protein F4804DRAFT_345497 [Jackrogersella minutella]|nr:hypothetical protein F4804DRAFT_345497 [Jackrogersella minutella]
MRINSANKAITTYLLEKSAEFRNVTELRQRGWDNPDGDTFFKKQRHASDNCNNHRALFFYRMMMKIGEELHRSTNAFAKPNGSPQMKILDMCMAPGGFLATALRNNAGAEALAFSLPPSNGGHRVYLPKDRGVECKFLDITMLSADMGLEAIPENHPDAGRFLPQQFKPGQLFDLVLCDGQVLRTQERAPYREKREANRLAATQLALGLEHLREGGTMVVLLHKLEKYNTAKILWTLSKFATVRSFKPTKNHCIRSSFYMVATNVRSRHPVAAQAIEDWKADWRLATFGTDEEYERSPCNQGDNVEEMLREFGTDLVNMGKQMWVVQADALAKAPFIWK